MLFQVKVRESMLAKIIELSAVLIVVGIFLGIVAIPIFMGATTTQYTNTSDPNTSTWIVVSSSVWGAENVLIWGTIITVALAVVIMLTIRTFQRKHAE